jgi:cysteine sulfinate desulfinase/cysteine desulfurase-like protein
MGIGAWDKMGRAKEDEFFDKKSKEAMEQILKKMREDACSPVSGEAMEQKEVLGFEVKYCGVAKCYWIEEEKLEQMLKKDKTLPK